MPQQNLVSETISPADLTAANNAIDALSAALDKYLLNLSPQQRGSLPKISAQDRAMATDALTVVTNDSSFMAQSFSVPEFQKDIDFFTDLYTVYLKLQPLVEKIDDTLMGTRSDLDNQMRDVYTSAKRNNVSAGMDKLNAYFGQRFRKSSAAKSASDAQK